MLNQDSVRRKFNQWHDNESYNASLQAIAKELKISRVTLSLFKHNRKPVGQDTLKRIDNFVEAHTLKDKV